MITVINVSEEGKPLLLSWLLFQFLMLQALQCLSKLLDELARCDTINLMYAVTNTNHILINTDGRVHRNTFMSTSSSNNTKSNILSGTSSRERAVSENKVMKLEYFFYKDYFYSILNAAVWPQVLQQTSWSSSRGRTEAHSSGFCNFRDFSIYLHLYFIFTSLLQTWNS